MDLSTAHQNNAIRRWLFVTALMVFSMAVIGAITRLTESGLSMVEWKPLIGAMPPLNAAEWERVFGLYKQTPEFLQKNSWMELADFKRIFFWEWLHRLWGRLTGLVFAIPLAVFWVRGMIPHGYKGKFLGILALGGLQGVMGWYMVASGLIDRPDVSHFRLAAHLLLAMLIYCLTLWLAFDFRAPVKIRTDGTFCEKRHGWIAFAALVVTISWGAFTAGLDGGMVYNTWPMMNNHFAPPELTGVFAALHDPGAVQFVHRWLAILTFLIVGSFALRMKNPHLAGMIFVQVGLGIATVMSQVALPLAALHQMGAMMLLYLMTKQMHALHRVSRARSETA